MNKQLARALAILKPVPDAAERIATLTELSRRIVPCGGTDTSSTKGPYA